MVGGEQNKMEVWEPIEVTNGNYSISSYGRVRSNDRIAPDGRSLKGKILNTYKIKPRGYHTVVFMMDGKKKHYLVHRLVYCTFNCIDLDTPLVVDHIDNCPDNNTLDNLQLVSQSDNIKMGYKSRKDTNYEVPKYCGGKAGRAGNHKQIIQMDMYGNTLQVFESLVLAEKHTGIRVNNISRCLRGIFRSSGGYTWKYGND